MLGKLSSLLVPALVAAALVGACSKEPGAKASDPAGQAPKAAAPTPAEGAAPAPEAKPAAAAEGKPRVEGQGFVVEVKPPADVAAGGEAAADVVLTATGEYHLNKDFPTALEITPPAGVELAAAKLTIADAASFEEKTATWKVKFTAKDAGDKKFAASFKFAVCTATTCDPKKEALGWTVAVK